MTEPRGSVVRSIMHTYREPESTQVEFEPVEVSFGTELDELGLRYFVERMSAEPDESLRERIREAMKVKRASDRIARGESVLPPAFVEAIGQRDTEIEKSAFESGDWVLSCIYGGTFELRRNPFLDEFIQFDLLDLMHIRKLLTEAEKTFIREEDILKPEKCGI